MRHFHVLLWIWKGLALIIFFFIPLFSLYFQFFYRLFVVFSFSSSPQAQTQGQEAMGAIPLIGCSVVSAEEKMKKALCFEISTRFRWVASSFLHLFTSLLSLWSERDHSPNMPVKLILPISLFRNYFLVSDSILDMAAWIYTIEHVQSIGDRKDRFLQLIDILTLVVGEKAAPWWWKALFYWFLRKWRCVLCVSIKQSCKFLTSSWPFVWKLSHSIEENVESSTFESISQWKWKKDQTKPGHYNVVLLCTIHLMGDHTLHSNYWASKSQQKFIWWNNFKLISVSPSIAIQVGFNVESFGMMLSISVSYHT